MSNITETGDPITREVPIPCDCSYSKISYSGTTKYYHRKNAAPPEAVCVGGSGGSEGVNGKSCTLTNCPEEPGEDGARPPEADRCACGQAGKSGTGTCTVKDKVETVLG